MTIEIVRYQPAWPEQFRREADALRQTLGQVVAAVHHIGSTAVPHLAAKPVIDILIEATALEHVDASVSAMNALGYAAMGEYGIERRRYYRKGTQQILTHHVHVFAVGDPHICRHVAFRDYLIAHRDIANEYAALKRSLARKCGTDIAGYCAGKDAFMKQTERAALRWYAA